MPVKVYNVSTQEIVEVPASKAQAGILRGQYNPIAGTKLRVAKGNRVGKVDPDNLRTALGQGARIIDEDEAENLRIRREEQTVAAGALGTLEEGAGMVTGGLSTALEEAVGVDPRRMAVRRETAGPAGTTLGVAGTVLSGGAGLAAKSGTAAARYGVPALLARAGRGVEGAVARALPAAAPRAIAKTLPTAVGQTVEGFGYAAGSELDEAVLGRRPIAGEHILAGGFMNGALGGSLGLLAPGVTRVVEGGVRGAGKLPAAAARKVGAMVDGSMPTSVGDIADRGARLTAKATGGDEARLLELASWAKTPGLRARAHKAIHDSDGMMREVADDVMPAIDNMAAALDDVMPAISRGNKPRHVDRYIPKDGAATERIHAAAKQIDDLEVDLAERMATNAAAGNTAYKSTDLTKVAGLAKRARLELEAAFQKGDDAAAFHAVDRLKQSIDDIAESRRPFLGTDSTVADTYKVLREMGGKQRAFLQDEKIWQEAGRRQLRMNAAHSASAAARQELGTRGSVLGRLMDRSKTRDPADVLALVKGAGSLKGQGKIQKMLDYVHAERDFLRTARELSELTPEQLVKIDAFEKSITTLENALTRRAKDAELLDLISYARKLEGSGSPSIGVYSTLGPIVASKLASGVSAGVGGLVGGIPGAIAGHALGDVVGSLAGSITRPHTSFKTLVALTHKADKAGLDIDATVGKFLGRMRNAGSKADGLARRIERGADKAGRELGRLSGSATRAAGRAAQATAAQTARERRDEADKYRARIALLATRPGMLADELAGPLRLISDHAPYLADTIVQKAQEAANFLATKIPATYEQPFGNGRQIVNTVEQSKWERYIETVKDPLSAIRRLAEGTLTREHVEALQAVYPEIYKSIVDSVWAEFAAARDEGRTVPFSARCKAAQLLQLPTDPVYDPDTLAAVQGVWTANATAEAAAASRGPGRPRKPEPSLATTPAQKTEI